MCGPSSTETSLQQQSQGFATTLQNNYGQLFNQQMGVLNSLNQSLNPIVQAGPSQNGFSGAQVSNLQTQAINNAGAAAQQAEQAARTYGAGQGGGATSGLTSGITKQIEAGIASQQAGALGSNLTGINLANEAQGNQNYWRAVGGQQALAQAYNPNAAANSAINEGGQSFQEANTINQQQNQEQAAIAGGIASLAMNVALPGIGGAMGGGGLQGAISGITG